MLNKIKDAVSNPVFQRKAVEMVVTIAIVVAFEMVKTVATNAIMKAVAGDGAEPQLTE